MGPIFDNAVELLNANGLNRGEVKCKEISGILPPMPRYSVSTREPGKRAGRQVMCLVIFPDSAGKFYL